MHHADGIAAFGNLRRARRHGIRDCDPMISDEQVEEFLNLLDAKDAQIDERFELHFGEVAKHQFSEGGESVSLHNAIKAAIDVGSGQIINFVREWVLENNQ